MKDTFESGNGMESMTEEELRDAARRYAHQLMVKGDTPASLEKISAEESLFKLADFNLPDFLQTGESSPEPESIATELKDVEPYVEEVDLKAISFEDAMDAPSSSTEEATKESSSTGSVHKKKKGFFHRNKSEIAANKDTSTSRSVEEASTDLAKLKKKDLLEIMLRQGEEIDALRAKVADLESRLEDKELTISKAGTLAEASLALTGIFKEAQAAADIYLYNIRKAAEKADEETGNRGETDER